MDRDMRRLHLLTRLAAGAALVVVALVPPSHADTPTVTSTATVPD